MLRLPGLVGQPATSALSVPSESSASFPDPQLLEGWRRSARCFPSSGDQPWEGVTVAVPSRGAAPRLSGGRGPVGWMNWGSRVVFRVEGWMKSVSSARGERPLAAGRACCNRGDALRAEPW